MQEKAANGKLSALKLPVKKTGKRIIIAVICVLIVAGSATAVILNKTKSANAQASTVYREYSVEQGDVTVGIDESGTVVVDASAVTFPLKATIDKILVTLGTTVKEGDPVAQLNADSIADVTDEYESKISDAKKDLTDALLTQKTGLVDAKQKYQSNSALTSSAPVQNDLTKTDLNNEIVAAQTSVSDLQASLSKYTALKSTNDTDIANLDTLDAAVDEITDKLADAKKALSNYTADTEDDLSDYKSIYNAYVSAKSAYDSAKSDYKVDSSSDTALKKADAKLDLAEDNYEDIEDDYQDIKDETETLNSVVDDYTDQLADAQDTYNDLKEIFDEKYEFSGDKLDDKILTVQEQLTTAQNKLTKLQKSYSNDVASADQTLTNSLSNANTAKEIYEKTVSQLAQKVQAAQDAYDLLVNQYAEIQESISADGVLYAPCSGTVSAINFEDSADYTANMTILSVADTKYVDLTFSVSEEDITSVSVGQEASVSLTAFDGQTFDAAVDTISFEPARSSSSVSYTVTVKLKDESGLDVYEGMSGDVTLVQKQVSDVLYVTNNAINYADGKSTVLIKNADGTQSTAEVMTGFSDGRYVEIKSGLSRGDTVLVESAVSAK